MPRAIEMDQNLTDAPIEPENPFFGSDTPEDDSDAVIDFGDEVDATPAAEEAPAADPAPEDESDGEDADAGSDDGTPDADATDADAEPEAADDVAEAPAEEAPQDNRIPKQRFDEINERRKAAEKKLADLEAAQAAAKQAQEGTFDYDAKEQEYMEAVVDGEFDKAKAIRTEIRQAEKAEYEAISSQRADASREQTKAELAFNETTDALQAQYPMFDKDSADFDEHLTGEALMLHEGFVNAGLDPIDSIKKAVSYVIRANGLEQTADAPAPAPKPALSDKPVDRKAAEAKAKAKTSQPQQMPKGESNEPALDAQSMSEAEWDALPESKQREMRGDFV